MVVKRGFAEPLVAALQNEAEMSSELLVLGDLVLGEKTELVCKQNVKCGAMETSAILTRLGMNAASIDGSLLFLPSRIPKT